MLAGVSRGGQTTVESSTTTTLIVFGGYFFKIRLFVCLRVLQWRSVDYQRPERTAIFMLPPEVVRCLMPPYYPHFSLPSYCRPWHSAHSDPLSLYATGVLVEFPCYVQVAYRMILQVHQYHWQKINTGININFILSDPMQPAPHQNRRKVIRRRIGLLQAAEKIKEMGI